ncbi:hypothetical protein [Kineococcus xinjiangensis]|uniref:hypothetical protein n=1 Tax=Kineococcus xinjiangensis TaxID=512762 RepID=UPI001304E9E4|nr:hypothetical protein [Kineococcus xinjiangensis]
MSVRCLFRLHFGEQQVFEERITLWHENDMDRAIALAEAEAQRYAESQEAVEYMGLAQAYLLDDEPGHGAEVFSLMRTSSLHPKDYLDTFFDTGGERVDDSADA